MCVSMQFRIILLIPAIAQAIVANGGENNSTSNLIPCEDGWFLFGDKCYRAFGEKKGFTWKQAATSCAVNHGSLVTVENKEVQDFLTSFLLLNLKSNAWIGLHDREQESQYVWEDGSVVSYTNWERGEPTGRSNAQEDCVEMRYKAKGKTGMWNDVSCDQLLPFICQSNKSEHNSNPDPRFCTVENGGGWKYLNSCYHVVNEELSWDDAENYCQNAFKGHLLSIPDLKAELFLNYSLSNFDKEFWIGLKIRDTTHQKWSSGWHVIFSRWENEHTHQIDGTCAMVTRQRLWSSVPCFQKLPFVCETTKEELPVLKQAPEGWKCPSTSEEWIDLGGDTCYIFETTNLRNWFQANFACSKKGGALASLHSAGETNAIQPYVTGVHEKLLIGLHRSLLNKDVFEWADRTDLDYLNWKEGEPNSKNEGCGEIWTESMKWNDVPCDIAKGYICSVKKIPPAVNEKIESLVTDSQKQTSCSGYMSPNTMLVVLFVTITILFLAGFAIYHFKDHFRSKNLHWKYFTLSSISRTISSEIPQDESDDRI